MNAQTKTQLTNAGIDVTQLSAEEAAVLETMNADELKAFTQAQQATGDQPKSKSGSFFGMVFVMF